MGKLFTFCSLYKLLYTSWLFVVVFSADKHLEEVQNWPQATLKQRETWWNQKAARLFVYHSNYNYLTWACFEVLSTSFRTSLSSTTLIFDYREYSFQSRMSSSSVKVGFTDITINILEKIQLASFFFEASLSTRRPQGYYCAINICPFSSGGYIIQKKNKRRI